MRHLFAGCDLARDRLHGHVKVTQTPTRFLELCRYLRALYPQAVRVGIVCDNLAMHRITQASGRLNSLLPGNRLPLWPNGRRQARLCCMDATHTAEEWSTSRHPQDWGRALSMVLARLAEQLAQDEGGKIDEVLLDRDVGVRIAPEADGIRITATCASPRAEGGHDFM